MPAPICEWKKGVVSPKWNGQATERIVEHLEGLCSDLPGCGKPQFILKAHYDLTNGDGARTARRMLKMTVHRGRSERRGESYSGPYVEPLSDARTKLADFFTILLKQPPVDAGHQRLVLCDNLRLGKDVHLS
jgi:hypothetical protein